MADHALTVRHTNAGWTGDCTCGWYTISFWPTEAGVKRLHTSSEEGGQ